MNREQKLQFDAGKRDAKKEIQSRKPVSLKPVVDSVGDSDFYGLGWTEVVSNMFGNN